MKIYTIEELAELFHVNKVTISRSVRRGQFPPPQRLGRGLRWHEEVISEWLKEPAAGRNLSPARSTACGLIYPGKSAQDHAHVAE
jgi:excisionase family DNA binding protein